MELTINSAAGQQSRVLRVLELHHGIVDIGRGLNLLYIDPKVKESTKPPSEDTQSRVMSLCEALCEGICDLVLTPRPFPHGVQMPQYLGWPNDTLWLFPSVSPFMSPTMLAERHTRGSPGWAYNFAEGRLNTLEELQAVSSLPGLENFAGKSDNRRRKILAHARRHLTAANKNQHHHQRRLLAFHAVSTFCILFLAETGMNWAQVTELSWSNDFEVNASHQGFRTIKWRAGGKLVSFELPVGFMPKFKQYLAIRRYLLNGRACDLLFFKQGAKGRGSSPTPLKSNLNSTYAMLRRIDPTLPLVTSREWRAAKSDWLVRNTDPSTAALVLQNSERTVLTSYAEGSESVHLAEMSNFLNEVASRVLPKDQAVEGGVSRAVGVCASFGTPIPIAEVSVQPDCRRPEGCLFCDKFKVHADAKDTRKLLSCRYCLRQTIPLAGSDEQINGLLGPIFNRIEVILDEVRKRDPKMVEQVTRQVEVEGELDPYWAQKYDLLVSLGVAA
jgi:integrase